LKKEILVMRRAAMTVLVLTLAIGAMARTGVIRAEDLQASEDAAKGKCVPHVPSSGDVLVTGGEDLNFNHTGNTEFFHVATGQWLTACPTKLAHDESQIVRVGNTLLVIAGEQAKKNSMGDHLIIKNTDVYNPSTGKFKKGPSLKTALEDFAAVRLPDGTILTVGGVTDTDKELAVQTAQLLSGGKWKTLETKMTTPRAAPCAAVMTGGSKSGKVLIAGGTITSEDTPQLASAEIYDPATHTFTATSQPMNQARSYALCTALPDGTVLVTGGIDDNFNGLDTAEIYHPDTDSFTLTTGFMYSRRVDHSATLLLDGTVLVAGGETSYNFSSAILPTADLYDPATGIFTALPSMNDYRDDATATLITTGGVCFGMVLIEGGFLFNNASDTAELYDPVAKTFTLTSPMNFAHGEANAAVIP
jgi:hypothetical protein